MNQLPAWIDHSTLHVAWDRIRTRFERAGLEARGMVVVPTGTREERHVVGALLGRTITRDTVRVDLAALDARLRQRSGVGGLAAVLTALYGTLLEDRPAARAARNESRERPLLLAGELVDAPWALDWIAGLRRTGLLSTRSDAERVVRDAATVLLELTGRETQPMPCSRVELGARLLGDAHALDRDRLLHRVVLRGLAAAAGATVPDGGSARERLWAAYGVEPDLLSRTCLVWRVRAFGATTAARVNLACDAGDPMHLTDWDLRRIGSLAPGRGDRVLVCENPRVVEAIAERDVAGWAAVCTAGEPNLVVAEVLRRLSAADADVRYHGDFDWPGIAIANRIVNRFGIRPWRMSADDYVVTVRPDGPALAGDPVEPSWDPELGAAMRSHGRAVHEEAQLAGLLTGLAEYQP